MPQKCRLSRVVSSYACLLLWALISPGVCQAFLNPVPMKRGRVSLFSASSVDSLSGVKQESSPIRFPDNLVDSLDLLPLLNAVSLHAGTRRGRQALLALVGADYDEVLPKNANAKKQAPAMSARSRRALGGIQNSNAPKPEYRSFSMNIASNQQEAQREYSLVAEALELLQNKSGVCYPPLYGATSSPWDTETVAETDFDDFLRTSVEESTLEQILHAEKVIETIRSVKEWGSTTIIQETASQLAEMASQIDYDSLAPLYQAIAGTVVLKRVRTLTDPSGRSSFRFELNADKFHIVEVLRKQVEDLEQKGKNDPASLETGKLADAMEQLEATEDDIQRALFQTILGRVKEINNNLNVLARLDVIFAKAAFGESTRGVIPYIGTGGTIEVEQFVHPVLLSEGSRVVVPIDLRLSQDDNHRALIISGPNGGGKTAAMKSFGLAAILGKLGLPIPCRQEDPTSVPRVDFFSDIHVALGDRQSLTSGESTMMARLNACASVIDSIASDNHTNSASIVLIDEIGGGTDPEAGGAIAQAILEKLLDTESCRIVATTHVPRLKVLSFESEQFGCATVLLEPSGEDNTFQQPSFELFYDSIGDSYALGAASRCAPALPEDLLSRAAQLMASAASTTSKSTTGNTSSVDGAYLQVLTESIKRQSEKAQQARIVAEQHERDIATCRRAMLSLASSYDREFVFLQQKLEDMYAKLKDSELGTVDVIGDTLFELRLVRKEIKSQAELLKEKGLKLLPDWHDLLVGDSVVIVSDDEMNGVSGTVISEEDLPAGFVALTPDDVAVLPSLSAWDDDFMSPERTPVILKRFQVAIYDYDSMWESEDAASSIQATSVKDSKRRLNEILLNLKSSPSSPPKGSSSREVEPMKKKFTSSRERKSSTKQTAKLNKKQRRRA